MLVVLLLFSLVNGLHGNFELTVIHTNDVHARIDEFDKYGNLCQVNNSFNCFGGVARRHTVIEEIRKNETNVILLDGGDQFQGTIWFSVYKGIAAVTFMNYTKYDAMAIGNHEFDNGPSGLVSFIRKASFSVLSSNMDATMEPVWPKGSKFNLKSKILVRNGQQIGVVGYTTTETSWLSKPGIKIKFYDVIESVRKEAKMLKAKGVKIIIALGHAGIEIDKQVAQMINEVDIVVGGHTNTFLYNGSPPSNDKIYGPYPLKFTRSDKTIALVVQDFTYAKYLGNLKVVFNDNGDVMTWSGNPILLDSRYKQDPTVLKMVKEMDKPIRSARSLPVGRKLVHLNGQRSICRSQECNFGNLIADAIVETNQKTPDNSRWATVALGMWNGGGIRASIDKNISDFITLAELTRVLPFGNTADIIEISGEDLRLAFEHSVSKYPEAGRFLQVSGFHVKYNLKKPLGNRVIGLKAICTECRIPRYEGVDKNKIYKVVTSNYLIAGGDGFKLNSISHHHGNNALDDMVRYFKQKSPVAPVVEGRIVFVDDNSPKCNSAVQVLKTKKLIIYVFLLEVLTLWR